MARYKHSDVKDGQGLFLKINLKDQLIPGTFEYMLNDLISNRIDISMFDTNYKNDETGSTAIPPAVLIKLIIYGYMKGITSSRKIGELASDNMVAKALAEDMEPHWTTLADFISSNNKKFQEIFTKVLMYCNELKLIGGETFAIDGLRLPSNASMDMSGTEAELEERLLMYRRMAERHVEKHRERDAEPGKDKEGERHYQERQKDLKLKIEKISSFLEAMEKKEGRCVEEIKSNVTDNESAMIHTSGGYIQGYIGIAVSDKKNQIIVNAEAVGTANEGEHFPKVLERTLETLGEVGVKMPKGKKRAFMGDANYFSEDNLKACKESGVEAIIPDIQDKRRVDVDGNRKYDVYDFTYNRLGKKCVCPQGKILEHKGTTKLKGGEREIYQASLTDCKACPDFQRCTWSTKGQDEIVQGKKLFISKDSEQGKSGNLCSEMRDKMATKEYKEKYAYRMQIVEPVFANIRYCKGLGRFTLRGKNKVNGQWLLFCLVHNLGKCLKGYNSKLGYV